ncbi:hypothetical protein BDK88_2107 [Natrinema hispanicum]|uniref:Uncharacterized protein n=1 Tax=Natrinema hispanicum TaxID=392421 RepID=A0A482YDZ2_9EURY|nr:hypothetical protein [Natrinema hispanicum]RZV10901.1 hypothetical protein BDK88_2107 [Natrinema hispanicum]
MDELSLQWTPVHGPMRKLVFEPQPDGEYAWARIEFELCESQWREVGFEYLEELSFVSDDGEGTSLPHARTYFEGGEGDV